MSYRIEVETFKGHLLTFHVDKYEDLGDSIRFIDPKTGNKKEFPRRNCQIEEL